MNKTALDPKAITALKVLLGSGAIGGAGYGGYRYGANKVADTMAQEFTEQNAIENQNIADSFNDFNVDENQQIAQNAFLKGVQYAMAKQSSLKNISEDRLEKIALGMKEVKELFAGAKGIGKKILGAYKKSGESLKDAAKTGKEYYQARKGRVPGMSIDFSPELRKKLFKQLAGGKLALGTGAGLAGGAYLAKK